MDTLEQGLEAHRKVTEIKPSAAAISPLAVIALSALGIVLGGAIVVQFSPLGSLGRYQFLLLRNSTVVRMDTTSGDLSTCYYGSGNIGQPATCFPWSHATRDFMPPKDTGAAQ
ncbi:hypothetical protein [Rhizobium ruizarguesonis]|uniref:hypothetical protein n=1 Tax=Rhizobium ruizarguesonis TaxID=2081791 RepID=UPI00102F5947|nr:hypothetical protein [Rhizobium ruizarguesonis]TAU02191.1 hypothetical protein ELI53_22930 [Rhizobium ruizarguesonis]